ncbi:MAG TPA: DUF3426 domain-containing protein [Nitrosopumilaceae archaeon]|nr:DUF3426 domain-containing protein [Nitrosopumilaceae archaeon]
MVIPLIFGISNAWAEVFIQNDQHYIGSDGSLHIVGEIKNELQVPLNQIDVHVTLYSEKEIVDTIRTGSLVNTIMPEMKGPFELVIIGQKAQMIDDYSIEVDYKVSGPKSQVIDVTSSDITRDKFDNLVITGTVTNNGEITANAISVVATLYDRDGNVAAVSKSLAKPDYLRSNDEVFFLVPVTEKQQTLSVVDYTLVAESEEYAAAPEFPIGTLLLLGGSVSAYVILTRYSTRTVPNLISATSSS